MRRTRKGKVETSFAASLTCREYTAKAVCDLRRASAATFIGYCWPISCFESRDLPNQGRGHFNDAGGDIRMSMQTTVHEINGVIVIDLSGRITLGDGSVLLRDQIREELAKGNKQILLNLADVSYMDSSGLGELISAYTSVKNRGGEVKLLKLTRRVRDLMEIVKLYTVFDIYDDEASGIASFTNED